MVENLLDPVVLFFVLGVLAGIFKSDLRLPEAIYEAISIYLLVAIGLKGGVQLTKVDGFSIIGPVLGTLALGVLIPVVAYLILRRLGNFNRPDAAALAAHYGSVSAVTFAVVQSFLDRSSIPYEGFTTFLLVLLEIPAIAVAILIVRLRASKGPTEWNKVLHEVFLNKSIYLLLGGLIIGAVAGSARMQPLNVVFLDPFKGLLAFFLLEMGIVASRRLGDLKKIGPFLIVFGIGMPLLSSSLAIGVALLTGMSLGGAVVLATLAASASYIAAPAAMRIAVPEANPTFYLTASLGVTFPFNLTLGIPLYLWLSQVAFNLFR